MEPVEAAIHTEMKTQTARRGVTLRPTFLFVASHHPMLPHAAKFIKVIVRSSHVNTANSNWRGESWCQLEQGCLWSHLKILSLSDSFLLVHHLNHEISWMVIFIAISNLFLWFLVRWKKRLQSLYITLHSSKSKAWIPLLAAVMVPKPTPGWQSEPAVHMPSPGRCSQVQWWRQMEKSTWPRRQGWPLTTWRSIWLPFGSRKIDIYTIEINWVTIVYMYNIVQHYIIQCYNAI